MGMPSGDNIVNGGTQPGTQPGEAQPTAPDYDLMPKIPTPPKALVCCITKKLMRKPVTASDGHTYEKSAIIDWIQKHEEGARSVVRSPTTWQPLKDTRLENLIPNYAIKNDIDEWLDNNNLEWLDDNNYNYRQNYEKPREVQRMS